MTKNNQLIKKYYRNELLKINNLLLNNTLSKEKKEELEKNKKYLTEVC